MKKVLITAILSIVAIFPTLAQSVFFNNIGPSTDAIVTYGYGVDGLLGTGLLSTYTAGLYYAFGTVSWNDPEAQSWPRDPGAHGFTLLPTATGTFNFGPTAGVEGAGYFDAGIITIPGYVSGAISFVIVAYEGSSYNFASYRGHSASFTLSQIATGITPVGEFGEGFQSFVVVVPEPTTFALAGLGLASLVIFRRRK